MDYGPSVTKSLIGGVTDASRQKRCDMEAALRSSVRLFEQQTGALAVGLAVASNGIIANASRGQLQKPFFLEPRLQGDFDKILLREDFFPR